MEFSMAEMVSGDGIGRGVKSGSGGGVGRSLNSGVGEGDCEKREADERRRAARSGKSRVIGGEIWVGWGGD
jgi:hypothetical protein